jgi:hypothetical protein
MEAEKILGVISGVRRTEGMIARPYTLVLTDRQMVAVPIDDTASLAEAREVHVELWPTNEGRTDVVACEKRVHLRIGKRLLSLDPGELSKADDILVFSPDCVRRIDATRAYETPIWPWEGRIARVRIAMEMNSDQPGKPSTFFQTETDTPSLQETRSLLSSLFGQRISAPEEDSVLPAGR